ncbi:hypothetical protein B0I00_0669 [Novosphingobium kunmingense]|uniref:DUF1097 domain-containing protein n=1 Tax=Novosphingobium kunmingense TaxID=1211806 RepID=A0A2N0I2P4_9SPHN|nr:hypothetical protein [Novosphingobium kunmingense]PKB25469.1 hypothetical protein B0I00_0669 [Novosphingobium kunmingense]
MTTDSTTISAEAAPPPGPAIGFGILIVVLIGLIVWTVLMTRFVTPLSLFGGYLMLWYWANIEQLAIRRLPAALVGAMTGIALAWILVYAPAHYGTAGLIIGLLALIVALYLDILKAVPFAINAATMLYVTVAAAPLIQLKVDWIELILATIGGGLFFAGFVESIKWLAGKVFGTPAS